MKITVEEMIAKLQKLNPKAVIVTTSDNFELNYAKVAATHVHEYKEGSTQRKMFRDAFDGDSYHKDVFSVNGGDGSTPIVLIS